MPTAAGLVVIPLGFLFDGASYVRNLSMVASAVHDWLYLTRMIEGRIIDRLTADQIYRDLLIGKGHTVLGPTRYYGLRMFGGGAWDEHREREESGVDMLAGRVLPRAHRYYFPTWELADVELLPAA